MKRRTFLGISLAALVAFSGCARKTGPNRQLSKSEIEADIAKSCQLHEVTLTEETPGHFNGTGKNAQGKEVKVEVVQEPRRRTWKVRTEGPNEKNEMIGKIAW